MWSLVPNEKLEGLTIRDMQDFVMDPISFFPFVLIILLVILFFLAGDFHLWPRGNRGEYTVNSGLSSYLDEKTYRVIADVTLPSGDGTTQIDHLVVSRYGIFVIETKDKTGWIFGHPDHARWTQVIYRDRYRFQNPIRQNYKHVKTVQELLCLSRIQVLNVVVFIGDCRFKTPMPPAVVKGVSGLVGFIRSKRAIVIDDAELPRLVAEIQAARLERGYETDRAHVRNVRRQMAERRQNTGACPLCGGVMVGRTNKSTGERFLGCTRYPECKGTRRVE